MTPTESFRLLNAGMIAFDLALGTSALLAPAATLRIIGHEPPAPDAEALFRRAGPIWLTFAAAHAVAAVRNRPEDWVALAWLRGTEIGTDVLWAESPGVKKARTRWALRGASVFNLGFSVAAAAMARRDR
ncbi:MAG: hypothetical protein JHC95_06150 [Solirubrobacteraceae bacterium]|nr:hypothetical protein [Solirubrobacteraceae bacterium]